jgi:hypothetical protein
VARGRPRPGGRQDYVDNLTLMRDLDFDVLVPWGATQSEPYVAVDRPEAQEYLDAIIRRVAAGPRSLIAPM